VHALTTAAVVLGALIAVSACKPRATAAQCDELVGHYAALVVKERIVDASAAVIEAEQRRERDEATHDDAFRNCTTELEPSEYACAMAATTADALEKCVE
jgi:hypothetical protein